MNNKRSKWRPVQIILGIVITLATLYFALKGVNLSEVWRVVRSANLWFVILAILGIFVQNILKTIRWKIILHNPNEHANWWMIFSALMVGQLLNFVIPARAGDISRGYLVGSDGLGKSYTYGTIVFEKIVDLLIYVFYVGILLISMPLPGWISQSFTITGTVTIVLVVITVLFSDHQGRLINFIEKLTRWVPERIHTWVFDKIRAVAASFNVVQDRKRLFQVMLLGLVIWGLTVPIHQLTLMALDLDLPLTASLMVWIVLQVGISLPAAPGRFGVFEYSCMLALSLFGVSEVQGVGFGFLLHGVVLAATIILGLSGFIYLNAINQTKSQARDLVN